MKRHVEPYDLLEQMILSRDKELELQATEYERRLQSLNGEAGRIRDILKESIPREVFDREMNSINDKIEIITRFKNAQEGRSELTRYIPWLIAIGAALLAYFKK
jgi:hypothetical protein